MSERILGIDYGEKRIGLAISDELGITAQSLRTIENRNNKQVVHELRKIIKEKNISEVVVGLPKSMRGTIERKAKETIKFAEHLRERIGVPVSTWDERLTTAAAEKSMIHANLSRKKRSKKIDKIAAQLILQGFLDAKKFQQEKSMKDEKG